MFDGKTLLCQAVGSELAHADAMTPATTSKNESSYAIVLVVDSIDDEKLFLQTERRTDAAAANVTDALRADDFQIDYAS